MNANVLLNLLTELGKRDEKRGLQLGAPMLDPIYHMTFKLFKNRILGVKSQDFRRFF